jgi:hypothetical protein
VNEHEFANGALRKWTLATHDVHSTRNFDVARRHHGRVAQRVVNFVAFTNQDDEHSLLVMNVHHHGVRRSMAACWALTLGTIVSHVEKAPRAH